jgi:hypothetical protein
MDRVKELLIAACAACGACAISPASSRDYSHDMVCNINDIDGETPYFAFTSGDKGTLVQTVFQKDHDKPIATNTVWAFEGDDLIAPSNGITIHFANDRSLQFFF